MHGTASATHGRIVTTLRQTPRRLKVRSRTQATSGTTMAVGLDSIASTYAIVATAYLQLRPRTTDPCPLVQTTYCHTASTENSPHNRSFMPDTHATLST